MPDSKSKKKLGWAIETTLLSTFKPKIMIAGNVPGPLQWRIPPRSAWVLGSVNIS